MRTIKMIANELVDGEIDFVSLVKHGANRSPFKIIKMEDLSSIQTGLMDKLTSMFGDEPAKVSAFFVKNEEVTTYAPLLEAGGFKVDDTQKMRDVTIYKQDCFDGDVDVSLIALDSNVGLALDRVVKQFSSFPESSDFKENVAASSFFPGLHNAMEALGESTWQALNKSLNIEEAGIVIDKNLAAFKKHINALVKNLPHSVIKFESELLRLRTGGSTLDTVAGDIAKSEDNDMTRINEAVAGDLGGLNAFEDQDAEALAKAENEATLIVFVDEDGKEVSDEAFAKFSDEKKAKGKKMRKAADGTLSDIPVQFFDADGKIQFTKDAFEALEDETKVVVKQEGEEDRLVTKANILGQGEGAFKGKSPGSAVVAETSDSGAADLNEGLPAGFREMQKAVKKFVEGELVDATAKFLVNDETKEEIFVEYVEKQEEVIEPDASAKQIAAVLAGPLDLIGKAMNQQNETLAKISDRLEAQDTKIEALQKSTTESIKKTAELTLVDQGADLDQSFGLLSGTHKIIEKQDAKDDTFLGLCPELDALEAAFQTNAQAQ